MPTPAQTPTDALTASQTRTELSRRIEAPDQDAAAQDATLNHERRDHGLMLAHH